MMFIENVFPLSGNLAELLLVLEWILILFYFEFAIIFLNRVFMAKNELKSLQERGYISLYLGFSLMWIFFIIADHYINSPELRIVFLNCGYISMMLGAVIFIYIIESYRILLKKYLFTIIFTVTIVIFFLIVFYDLSYGQFMSFIFWPIFGIFFIFYTFELNSIFKSNPILGKFKNKYFQLVIGMILLSFGFSLTTDLTIILFGLISRIIGDFMQIGAIFFLCAFFLSTPSFSEYDWQKKVESLIIMHKSGLLIYEKSFEETDDKLYRSSVSGTIASLRIMLEQISEEQDMSIIEKKGKYIIIQPGHFIYGVLISEEKLNSLQYLLKNLVEKIEGIYYHLLEEWDGDLNVFSPIKKIIEDCLL